MATKESASVLSCGNVAAWFNTSNSDAIAWVKDILREPLNAVKQLSKHVIWCGVEVAALATCLMMLSLAWAWTKTFRMTSIVLLMTATLLSSCMDLYGQPAPTESGQETAPQSVEEKKNTEHSENKNTAAPNLGMGSSMRNEAAKPEVETTDRSNESKGSEALDRSQCPTINEGDSEYLDTTEWPSTDTQTTRVDTPLLSNKQSVSVDGNADSLVSFPTGSWQQFGEEVSEWKKACGETYRGEHVQYSQAQLQAARTFLNDVTSDRREPRRARGGTKRSALRNGQRPALIFNTHSQAKKPLIQPQPSIQSKAPEQTVLPPHLRKAIPKKKEYVTTKTHVDSNSKSRDPVSALPCPSNNARLVQNSRAAEETDSTRTVAVPSGAGAHKCIKQENQEKAGTPNQEREAKATTYSTGCPSDTTDSSKSKDYNHVSKSSAQSPAVSVGASDTVDLEASNRDAHAVPTLRDPQQSVSDQARSTNSQDAHGSAGDFLTSGNSIGATNRFSWIVHQRNSNLLHDSPSGRERQQPTASPTPHSNYEYAQHTLVPKFIPQAPLTPSTMLSGEDKFYGLSHSSHTSEPALVGAYGVAQDALHAGLMSLVSNAGVLDDSYHHLGHPAHNPWLGYTSASPAEHFQVPIAHYHSLAVAPHGLSRHAHGIPQRSNSVNLPPTTDVSVGRHSSSRSRAIPIVKPSPPRPPRSDIPASMQLGKENVSKRNSRPVDNRLLIDLSEEIGTTQGTSITFKEKDNTLTQSMVELGELDDMFQGQYDRPVRVDTPAEALIVSDVILGPEPKADITAPRHDADPGAMDHGPPAHHISSIHHDTWNESSSDESTSSPEDKQYQEIEVGPISSEDQLPPIAAVVESPSKPLDKGARRQAREQLDSAYKKREAVRKRLNSGFWEVEILAEFERLTENYNDKRATLAALMASRELNEEDARLYPKLSKLDVQPPRRGQKNKKKT